MDAPARQRMIERRVQRFGSEQQTRMIHRMLADSGFYEAAKVERRFIDERLKQRGRAPCR